MNVSLAGYACSQRRQHIDIALNCRVRPLQRTHRMRLLALMLVTTAACSSDSTLQGAVDAGAGGSGKADNPTATTCEPPQAPQANPSELINHCAALPGANVNGRLECIANGAPSPHPSELINHCAALPGANINGQLDCIAAAAHSTDPATLINHCAALPGANLNGQLDCIRGADHSSDPATLINHCAALPGANINGQLTCIAAGAASSNPATLVNYCAALPGANLDGQLECIRRAARSPDPATLINHCKALPGANINGQLDCIDGGADSTKPDELVNHCAALPGANLSGQLDCIRGAARSPVPAELINACAALPGVNVNGMLACIAIDRRRDRGDVARRVCGPRGGSSPDVVAHAGRRTFENLLDRWFHDLCVAPAQADVKNGLHDNLGPGQPATAKMTHVAEHARWLVTNRRTEDVGQHASDLGEGGDHSGPGEREGLTSSLIALEDLGRDRADIANVEERDLAVAGGSVQPVI